MPKEQTLTVAELKSLFLASFNAKQSKQEKLNARFQQKLGNEVREEKSGVIAIAIKNKFVDWICDLLAHRLERNCRTTPLFSSQDVVQLIPLMINEIAKAGGEGLEAGERKMFEKIMKGILENVLETVLAMVPPDKDPYDEYWRWVTTVLALAAERNIPPTDLLAFENATDEVTRRMFTKEQFVAMTIRGINKFMDADALKKAFLQPMLDFVTDEYDEEEWLELEQKIEAELMPKVREDVEKFKAEENVWLGEEVARIYS